MIRYWLGLLTGVLLAGTFACNKPTGIGKDIFPGSDFPDATLSDTSTLRIFTERDDSLRTNGLTRYVLGSNEEPEYGKSFASIYSQMRLPTNNVDLGENLVLDSAVLSLDVNDVYGEFTQGQSFNVYRMTEDMDPEVLYYSYSTFATDPGLIGNKQGVIPKADSTIRIPLNAAFGNELLQLSGTDTMADNDAFMDYFKGLQIVPDTTNGYGNGFMYINMGSAASTVTLYYSNDDADSLQFIFLINSGNVITNYFDHNYSNTPVQTQLDNPGYDSVGYLQAMAGLRTRVNMPHIDQYRDVSINKAELVITSLSDHATYLPPQVLQPRIVIDGNEELLLDAAFEISTGAYSVDGSHSTANINGKVYNQYRVNLLRHIQLMVNGVISEEDIILKIVPAQVVASRTKIAGGNYPDPDLRIKLNLYYTKIR